MTSKVPIALTIAGSDPSGGAGIQADLKTFAEFDVYGASVITALTAQNTRGVFGVHAVPQDFIRAQFDAIIGDLDVGAIKTGMLGDAATVRTVARVLKQVASIPVVVDPVMVASSGDPLLSTDAIAVLRDELLPLAAVLTPNLPEAAMLLGETIATDEAESNAAGTGHCCVSAPRRRLSKAGTAMGLKPSISSLPGTASGASRAPASPPPTPMAPAARCQRRSRRVLRWGSRRQTRSRRRATLCGGPFALARRGASAAAAVRSITAFAGARAETIDSSCQLGVRQMWRPGIVDLKTERAAALATCTPPVRLARSFSTQFNFLIGSPGGEPDSFPGLGSSRHTGPLRRTGFFLTSGRVQSVRLQTWRKGHRRTKIPVPPECDYANCHLCRKSISTIVREGKTARAASVGGSMQIATPKLRGGLRLTASAAALAATTTMAAAGGFAPHEQSAVFLGTSFAGSAAGGALSSMFWNPAALRPVQRRQFGVGLFADPAGYGNHGDRWHAVWGQWIWRQVVRAAISGTRRFCPRATSVYQLNDQIVLGLLRQCPVRPDYGRQVQLGRLSHRPRVEDCDLQLRADRRLPRDARRDRRRGPQVEYIDAQICRSAFAANRSAPSAIKGDDVAIGFTAGIL